MYLRRLILLLVASTLSLAAETTPKEPPPPGEKIIRLPEVAITETMKLRPEEKWLTGTVGNFEIFSTASEKETKDFVAKLYKFHNAFTFLFPKANSLAHEKVTLVLCGTIDKFWDLTSAESSSESQASGSKRISNAFGTYLVINLDVKSSFSPSGGDSLEAQHTGMEFMDGEELIRREYIHLLFSHCQPRPPAWLDEGVARYFSSLKVGTKSISYAQLTKEVTYFFKGSMLSMPELFETSHESRDASLSIGGTFSDQSFMFVHYGMFAYKMRHQKAFLKFVDRAAREPVTEEMFRETFAMGFDDMLSELRSYVEGGFYRHAVAPSPAKLPPVPAFKLHIATDAEAGRVKGDTLRLLKHYDDARIELISPIIRKHADARLLSALGILDFETGNLKSAQKYLEQSIAAKVDHPEPYLTLAKLRLEGAIATNSEAKLNPTQLHQILTPLFASLELNQPPVETYLLIADAWDRSQTAPTFDNLVVLDQGVIAFPRNTELIYKNAVLKARHGFTDDARSVAELGVKTARNADDRARFSKLIASLPAAVSK